jgi:hypothetical protein
MSPRRIATAAILAIIAGAGGCSLTGCSPGRDASAEARTSGSERSVAPSDPEVPFFRGPMPDPNTRRAAILELVLFIGGECNCVIQVDEARSALALLADIARRLGAPSIDSLTTDTEEAIRLEAEEPAGGIQRDTLRFPVYEVGRRLLRLVVSVDEQHASDVACFEARVSTAARLEDLAVRTRAWLSRLEHHTSQLAPGDQVPAAQAAVTEFAGRIPDRSDFQAQGQAEQRQQVLALHSALWRLIRAHPSWGLAQGMIGTFPQPPHDGYALGWLEGVLSAFDDWRWLNNEYRDALPALRESAEGVLAALDPAFGEALDVTDTEIARARRAGDLFDALERDMVARHPSGGSWRVYPNGPIAWREALDAVDSACVGERRSSEPSTAPSVVRLAMVGDMMLGSTWPDASGGRLPPDDGAPLLESMAALIGSADIAIGNLEGPLSDGGGRPECTPSQIAEYYGGGTGPLCFAFRMPEVYGSLLARTGFDVLSVANNHSRDFGEAGFATTLRVLEAQGISATGARDSLTSRTVRAVRVAVLAFAPYPTFNPMDPDDDVRRRVRAAAETHDVVIVTFHAGAEGEAAQRVPQTRETFHGEDRGHVRAFAHAAIDAGADVVFGHGPHVLRGIEVRAGRLIAYSLGNFASWRGVSVAGRRGLSYVLDVTVDARGEIVSARVHPTRQPRPGGASLDPSGRAIEVLRSLSRDDFGQAAPRIADDGTIDLSSS